MRGTQQQGGGLWVQGKCTGDTARKFVHIRDVHWGAPTCKRALGSPVGAHALCIEALKGNSTVEPFRGAESQGGELRRGGVGVRLRPARDTQLTPRRVRGSARDAHTRVTRGWNRLRAS